MTPNDDAHTQVPPGPAEDFVLWADTQAALLRARKFDLLDIDNLVEEIGGMVRSDRHQMRTRLALLMGRLLKYSFHPGPHSTRIDGQRKRLRRLLSESPSLRRELGMAAIDAYADAIESVSKQTCLPASAFPPECPYSVEQLLDYQYLPAASSLPRSP